MTFEKAIEAHLTNLAASDPLFAETFKKPNKNLKDCCTYITNEVQKMHTGQRAVHVDDDEVFGMAVHYYDEDSIVIEAPKAKSAVSSPTKPKEAPKKAEPTTEAPKPAKKPATKLTVVSNQPTLF